MDFRWFVIAGAAIIAAGCDHSSQVVDGSASPSPKNNGPPRVVVALPDSGINPYHSFFNASEGASQSPIYPPGSPPSAVTPEVLAEFGIDENHILTLTRTGNPEQDFAADAALWANVKLGKPYWFRGTNLIAVGRDKDGPPILPDDNTRTQVHGVVTSAALLTGNPEAIVFFVEHDQNSGDIATKEIHDIAFLHPAVDIVSTSYGAFASTPQIEAHYDSFLSTVWLGKLHFSSAGNDVALTAFREGAGPWWSIGISGFWESSSNGRTTKSGYFPDFVAAYRMEPVPLCQSCQTEYDFELGTSFSTPRAAGVASRVILEARRAVGHSGGITFVNGAPVMVRGTTTDITNWQVRRALEHAAYVPTLEEYDPIPDTPFAPIPVLGVAPWLQVAWGLLTPDPNKKVVQEALAFLGFGTPTRTKDPGFCDFQTKLIEARHEYWDNVSPTVAPVVESLVPAEFWDDLNLYHGEVAEPLESDPFIYCGSTLPPLDAP